MISTPLLVLLALAPSRVEIREMVERAEAAYGQGQWDAASRGFADAFAVDPDPDDLFARAQAERFAGRCNVAIKLWDQYLGLESSPQAVAEARHNRAYCEPATTTGVETPADTGAQPSSSERRGVRPSRPMRAWYRDPAGGVLVATGGVSMVIGASVLGLALSRDRKASGADTEGSYVAEKDAVRAPHRAGIAVLSVGGALLVAGVVRWAVIASRSRQTARASVQPTWWARSHRVRWGAAASPRAAALSFRVEF
jgi:hypothetical protein